MLIEPRSLDFARDDECVKLYKYLIKTKRGPSRRKSPFKKKKNYFFFFFVDFLVAFFAAFFFLAMAVHPLPVYHYKVLCIAHDV